MKNQDNRPPKFHEAIAERGCAIALGLGVVIAGTALFALFSGALHAAEHARSAQPSEMHAPPPAPPQTTKPPTPLGAEPATPPRYYVCPDGTVVLRPADCAPLDHGGFR